MKKIIIILLFLTLSLSATIINVPADIDSIQGGINLATNGDTVLVHPGTYVENINFNGKNIVVGSLTLTTGDTSYISQTIISADTSINRRLRGRVVTFENGEDSTAVLCGFTITNGFTPLGGGIFLYNSNAEISQVMILSNSAFGFGGFGVFVGYGGGIFLYNSHLTILNSQISNNYAVLGGGGIFCDSSSLILNNVIIKEDSATGSGDSYGGDGGGIYLTNSIAEFNNVLIMENDGDSGGGILCSDSNLDLLNVTISDNTGQMGGGIYSGPWWEFGQGPHDTDSSKIYLSNVTITNNSAFDDFGNGTGGGIYSGSHTRLNYDSINRCNIYNNHADSLGNDFYSTTDTIISVNVDTFTVLNPDSFHAFPLNTFTFDILHDTTGNPNNIYNINTLPQEFVLEQNYPNPFNPSTTIEFSIPKAEFVTLKIYNLLGQEVATLVSDKLTSGNYKYSWDASEFASGVYLYKIEAGSYVQTRKLILMK